MDIFQSCGHWWVFQICWHIECSTFMHYISGFEIAQLELPPLALFVVMLPKAHLTSHSRMSGSRWVITPLWLSGSWRSFLCSSSVYSCHVFLISSASVRSIWFLFFQFSLSVVSYSLRPHEPQHARLPCPSPTPGAYSSSHPLSRWCHPTISSSVVPFSSRLQSFPASGSFPVSQLFASGSQNIGVSASVISPSSEHPGLISFRMDWLDLFAV